MSLQSTDIQRKPSLLQRNSSQLLQHASKFSLKRSLTTKVSSSPTLQHRPRPSISFSTNTHSTHGRSSTRALQEQQRQQAQLQLKEYIPPPPLEDTANQIKPTSGKKIYGCEHNNNNIEANVITKLLQIYYIITMIIQQGRFLLYLKIKDNPTFVLKPIHLPNQHIIEHFYRR